MREKKIKNLLEAFVNSTDPAKTVSKVRFIGVETPSLPVFPDPIDSRITNLALKISIFVSHAIKYNESYRDGAEKIINFIKADQERGCETQYMLVSYSQGVISARLAMNLLNNNTDKVISSYAIGDPFQKANGVTSSRQFTAANTSPHTTGIGSLASAVLSASASQFPVTGIVFNEAIRSISAYHREMNRSNPFMYRDEGATGPVSRSLCHKSDLVCGPDGTFGIEAHTNYFNKNDSAGAVDLEFEISEFDKQVQTLANSTTSNPRQRVLTKTPSVIGGVTSYNVANTRQDDLCTWDEGSDGSPESTNVPCSIVNIRHTSENPKMTVTVTDSFGVKYKLSSSSDSINGESVDQLSGLNLDSWYKFKPYDKKDLCLDIHQEPDELISRQSMDAGSCSEEKPSHTYFSKQAFKAELSGTDKVRILWGYDDDYAWTIDNYGFNGLIMNPVSPSNKFQDFSIRLLFVDDEPYYVIQQEKCV